MSDKVKVALITGICTLIVGIAGTLGVSGAANNQQMMTVFVNGSEVKVNSDAYQALYDDANEYKSLYDDLKLKYDKQEREKNDLQAEVLKLKGAQTAAGGSPSPSAAPGIQYLTDAAPAYDGKGYTQYSNDGAGAAKTFSMAGKEYDNGFVWEPLYYTESISVHSLDGKYMEISGILGHVDSSKMINTSLEIYFDGKLKREVSLTGDMAAEPFSIDVAGVNQLKFIVSGAGYGALYGYANVTIR